MIADLAVGLLEPAEVQALARRIVELAKPVLMEDRFGGGLVELMGRDLADLEAALGRERESAFTQRLAEADDKRDRAFLALRNYAMAFSDFPELDKSSAARTISGVIRKRGSGLYRLNYAEESEEMERLLEDLQEDRNQQAIATIKGTTMVGNLAAAQREFERIYQQKVEEEDGDGLPRLKDTGRRLSRHLAGLLAHLQLGEEIDVERYGKVTGQVNTVVEEAMRVARQREAEGESTSVSFRVV